MSDIFSVSKTTLETESSVNFTVIHFSDQEKTVKSESPVLIRQLAEHQPRMLRILIWIMIGAMPFSHVAFFAFALLSSVLRFSSVLQKNSHINLKRPGLRSWLVAAKGAAKRTWFFLLVHRQRYSTLGAVACYDEMADHRKINKRSWKDMFQM